MASSERETDSAQPNVKEKSLRQCKCSEKCCTTEVHESLLLLWRCPHEANVPESCKDVRQRQWGSLPSCVVEPASRLECLPEGCIAVKDCIVCAVLLIALYRAQAETVGLCEIGRGTQNGTLGEPCGHPSMALPG